MSKYEAVPVPFVKIGNRRGLTDEQIANDRYLEDFVTRFRSSFERHEMLFVWLFIEPEL